MSILVSGILGYDRIMNYPGWFKDRIQPRATHLLNGFFLIDNVHEFLGGNAGNVAYNLKLIGENPHLFSAVGADFDRYYKRFMALGINTDELMPFTDEQSALSTILVDRDDNRMIGFHPGAARHNIEIDLPNNAPQDLLVIGASSADEVVKRYREAQARNIPYIFAPAHTIEHMSKEDLCYGYQQSLVTLFNDYEWERFREKTGKKLERILSYGVTVIITRGDAGSMIYTSNQHYSISIAERKKIISPFGAGDAYLAGIAAGVLHAFDWQVTGQIAATLASFSIETLGAQEHTFTMDLFNRRYRSSFHAPSPFER